jgi:hypothetical protein
VNLPDFASWGLQLHREIARFAAWAFANRETLGLFGTALGILAFVGSLIKNALIGRGKAPQIEFGFDRIDDLVGDESGFVITATNVGERAARQVRTEWYQESRCELHPPAQPFTLRPDTGKHLAFTVRPIDLILRIGRPATERRLGSLVLTYRHGWRRRRVGCSLAVATRDTGHAQTVIDFTPLPPKRLRDVMPFVGRIADARAAQARARVVAAKLAKAKADLAERGISVEPQSPDDDVFQRLLDELARRGWAWEFESYGSGYTVKAAKSGRPSSSQTIRTYGDTREDAVMVALAHALSADKEHRGAPVPAEEGQLARGQAVARVD